MKRPWCWERLRAGREGDDRGWDGWVASPTLWTWVWVDSRSCWWTGRRGVLWFMGVQRVGHKWETELNLMVKSQPANSGDIRDVGLIPGSGRSPEGGHGNSCQDSCLKNPMDRAAWQAIRSMGSQRVGHDWSNSALTMLTSMSAHVLTRQTVNLGRQASCALWTSPLREIKLSEHVHGCEVPRSVQ